jgi:hypothetical protein
MYIYICMYVYIYICITSIFSDQVAVLEFLFPGFLQNEGDYSQWKYTTFQKLNYNARNGKWKIAEDFNL